MAKKNAKLIPLTLQEIILRGDADTIRQALEARTQIDTLLEEREAAYRRISELEEQVEGIVGEEGVFRSRNHRFPSQPSTASQHPRKSLLRNQSRKRLSKQAKKRSSPTVTKTLQQPRPKASADQ